MSGGAVKAVLLTGRPGVGKTTLVRRVVERLECPAAGFYTEEVREGGRRVGFRLVTLDGRASMMAHVDFRGPHRVGRYGVDLRALDQVAVPEIRRGLREAEVVVIDEIGPMELRSEAFRQAVLEALASPVRLLATVMLRPHPFADALKRRPEVRLFEVTPANREALVEEVVGLLSARRGSG